MMRVRPATPADVPAMQRIIAASLTAPQWTHTQFHDSVAPPATDSIRRIVLVAEDEEASGKSKISGFAVVSALVSIYPVEAELESIAVDPAHRRRGTGSALLQAAEDWLTTLPVAGGVETTLRLEVRVSNLPAIHLYRTHGFADVTIRPGYYRNPSEDAICMEKQAIPTITRTSDTANHANGPLPPA